MGADEAMSEWTKERHEEAMARCEAATKGPCSAHIEQENHSVHAALPIALAEIERLRAAAEETDRRLEVLREFASKRRTPYSFSEFNDAYNNGIQDALRVLRGGQ
jgi:hypothetical protein